MGKLEIACFNIESALIAQQSGADRVELCADMSVGGTTPNLDDVISLKSHLGISLHIMIRPRGGNFVYSDEEFSQMKDAIHTVKELGVDGVVFGILKQDNTIDEDKNLELVRCASPMSCTFHRAFDQVDDYVLSLEKVIQCGFQTVLTSGCAKNVDEGKTVLKELVARAQNRIVIMPGGGLRNTNLPEIAKYTDASYFHSSAITGNNQVADPAEIQKMIAIIK